VLQCVAACCSVLQCVAVCCSVLQCVVIANDGSPFRDNYACEWKMSMRGCVAVCCSVLQRGAVWCSVVQCVAVCCSVLQCVAIADDRSPFRATYACEGMTSKIQKGHVTRMNWSCPTYE